jgi:hypothetical protein
MSRSFVTRAAALGVVLLVAGCGWLAPAPVVRGNHPDADALKELTPGADRLAHRACHVRRQYLVVYRRVHPDPHRPDAGRRLTEGRDRHVQRCRRAAACGHTGQGGRIAGVGDRPHDAFPRHAGQLHAAIVRQYRQVRSDRRGEPGDRRRRAGTVLVRWAVVVVRTRPVPEYEVVGWFQGTGSGVNTVRAKHCGVVALSVGR